MELFTHMTQSFHYTHMILKTHSSTQMVVTSTAQAHQTERAAEALVAVDLILAAYLVVEDRMKCLLSN